MAQSPCLECQDLLSGKTNRRHTALERDGLAQSVGFHGNRDDEYYYVCRNCGARFVGDSCGTWAAKD
jgi:hypothetical protein